MHRSKSALVAFSLIVCGASAARLLPSGYAGDGKGAAPKANETIAAKRYRTRVVVDASHGASAWIEELYFPEKGVCANVETKVEVKGKEFEFPHVLNAFYGPIRSKFRMDFPRSEADSESPVEDVRVPASVATAIFEAADLSRRLEQARHDIGPKVSDLGLCRDLDESGAPRETAKPTVVEWSTLMAYDYHKGISDLPEAIRALDGKRVVMEGHLLPLCEFENIHEFQLTQRFLSRTLPPIAVNSVVTVRVGAKQGSENTDQRLRVVGTFHATEVLEKGVVVSIFEIDAAAVEVLGSPGR